MRRVTAQEVAYVNGCEDKFTLPTLEKEHIDLKNELYSLSANDEIEIGYYSSGEYAQKKVTLSKK